MMRKVTLTRRKQDNDDQGIFGDWVSDSGFKRVSVELPDRGNQDDISCVKKGKYICRWFNSPKHGWCFLLLNVEGREWVEIHSANLAGDVKKGYVAQLLGCIALGDAVAKFAANVKPAGKLAQMGVTNSVAAIKAMQADMGTADFELTIQ